AFMEYAQIVLDGAASKKPCHSMCFVHPVIDAKATISRFVSVASHPHPTFALIRD
ncbi:unnamed protein product, partial [marine sediment metagenome]